MTSLSNPLIQFALLLLITFCLCSCTNDIIEGEFIGKLNNEKLDSLRNEHQITRMTVYMLKPKREFGLESYDSVLVEDEYYFPSGKVKKNVDYWRGSGQLVLTKEYSENGNLKYEKKWQAGQTNHEGVVNSLQLVTNYKEKQYKLDHSVSETFYNELGKEIKSERNSVTLDKRKLIEGFYETEWQGDSIRIINFFDEYGKLIKKNKDFFNKKGDITTTFDMLKKQLTRKTAFKYDEGGNLTFTEDHELDGLPYRAEFIYNGNKLVEQRNYACYGMPFDCDNFEMTYRKTIDYDEKGNKIKEISYGEDGKPTYDGEWKYEYGSYDLILEETYYNLGEKKRYVKNKYDGYGRILRKEKTSYTSNGKEQHITNYQYNSFGLLSKIVRKPENEDEMIDVYLYH